MQNTLSDVTCFPYVLWASDPVEPNQTVLLFGDGFDVDSRVLGWYCPNEADTLPGANELARQAATKLEILQANSNCLKVILPPNWTIGCYALQVSNNTFAAPLIFLNRPAVVWHLGDSGETVTPGEDLRIFGKNLGMGATSRAVLQDATGAFTELMLTLQDKYTLTVQIPVELEVGDYQLYVHNGRGGRLGWSDGHKINIGRTKEWPLTLFDVKKYGAVGDGRHDDTAALRQAINAAKSNGGGVVYLSRGIYRLTDGLVLPRYTVLRGEKRETTWLFVPKEQAPFESVLAGDGEFGVEELSIVAKNTHRLIVAPAEAGMYQMPFADNGFRPATPANDIFLRRLRLHHLRYAHRVGTLENDPRRAEVAGPATVSLGGERLNVTDCEIVSAGIPLDIRQTRHSVFCRNHLHNGRNGWYRMAGVWESVFEQNIIEGRDLEASYGSFAAYDFNTEIARLYVAHNLFRNGFGGEREAITFDSVMLHPWFGPLTSATTTTVEVEGANWQLDELVGLGVLVAAGRGLGQHRRVISNSANSLTVESAWEILPEPGSLIAVQSNRRDVVVYKNESYDTSVGVQLWGGGYNFIIDGNLSVRTGGIWGTGIQYYKNGKMLFLHCFFTQWLNNHIQEGFIYQQGPDDIAATMGVYNRQTLPQPVPAATPIRGIVMRNNSLRDGSRIIANYYGEPYLQNIRNSPEGLPVPAAQDILIENNQVSYSAVGVDIGLYFEAVLVRHNEFEQVEQPVRDEGGQALIIPLTENK